MWEIEQIGHANHVAKTLFLLPPKFNVEQENARLWWKVLSHLGNGTSDAQLSAGLGQGGVIGFFVDGSGTIRIGRTSTFSRDAYFAMLRLFLRSKYGLARSLAIRREQRIVPRPWAYAVARFERLGLTWSVPRITKRSLVLIATSTGIAVFAGIFLLWIELHGLLDSSTPYPLSSREAARPSTTTAYDAALARFAARVGEIVEFRDALRNTASPQEVRALGAQLAQRGLQRLSDSQLSTRYAYEPLADSCEYRGLRSNSEGNVGGRGGAGAQTACP